MAKSSNVKDSVNKAGFPIPVGNYKMILIGFGIVILGFILMMGGGSEDPNQFNYDIFSFRRITLAPIVVGRFWICFLGNNEETPGEKRKS